MPIREVPLYPMYSLKYSRAIFKQDGYPGYNDVANKEAVTRLGYWAYVRPRFADIMKSVKGDAKSKHYTK